MTLSHRDLIDLTSTKQIESFRSIEVKFRFATLLASCVLFVYLLDQSPALVAIWMILYSVAVFALFGVVAVLPDEAPQSLLGLLVALYTLESICYLAMPVWLWAQGGEDHRLVASFYVFAAILRSVSAFSTSLTRRLNDAFWILVALALMTWINLNVTGSGQSSWALLMAVVLLFGYFLLVSLHALRIQRNLAKASEDQIEAERNGAIAQLTGGVAHDFNNLLTVILGNIELAQGNPDKKEQQELLKDAYESAQKGAKLTSQLLCYARKSILSPQEVDLRHAIPRQAEILRRALPSTISVITEMPGDAAPRIFVDLGKFETVLLNLALNARDAMPEGGRIIIHCRLAEDKNWVEIGMEDNGHGISPQELAKVTEPFYTTKPVGKGTGLGLSMACGFVAQSGGHLKISSIKGEGTTVTVELPLYAPARAIQLR